MKKVRVIWAIIYTGGLEEEFLTNDCRPVWSSKAAAQRALKRAHKTDEEYEIVRFVRKASK